VVIAPSVDARAELRRRWEAAELARTALRRPLGHGEEGFRMGGGHAE
jgi:hypothetical protein